MDARGWDDPKAKTHFVEACVGDTQVGDGSTTIVDRAPEAYCECVFDDLKNVHKLEWGKMLDFEKSLAKVSAGNPPDVPTEVKKAMEACDRANAVGPVAPSSDGDTTPTTEAGSN